MRRFQMFVIILSLVFISGCNFFAPPAAEQTLVAAHASTATQMFGIRQTATTQADRLAITLEFAQTAVGAANAQSTRIAATLMATGVPLIDARSITPLFATPAPNDVRSSNISASPVFAITPMMSGDGAQGNLLLENPPVLTPLPPAEEQTQDPDAPSLNDIALASSVGANDCPASTTTVFPTNADGVYITAVARNLTPSNVVVSRWLREGVEAVFYEWSPGFDIAEGCIWFYMPASDVDFSAANWSVQLELDAALVGQPVAFTVTGSGDAGVSNDPMQPEPTQSS